MTAHNVAAYLVPTADPHLSEYVADHWKTGRWASGFTGSAGTLVLLADQAGLWTDGRYFIQAEQELTGSGIDLFKWKMPGVPEIADWLCAQLPAGSTIGVDGRQLSADQGRRWQQQFEEHELTLRGDLDLITPIWIDRPALTFNPIRQHNVHFAGKTVAEKLTEIQQEMAKKKADCYLISSLYDIAWLFNLRGSDITHCPVFNGYALIESQRTKLFLATDQVSTEIKQALEQDGIDLFPYETCSDALSSLPPESTIFVDLQRTNFFLTEHLSHQTRLITGKELTARPKALKNETQLKHWHRISILDGIAMVRFLKWLEENRTVTECEAADQLERVRRSHPECLDLSFSSISAYGPNAAMMHYSPRPTACATLQPRGLYLIDSGGQYEGGTTDITRTWALGPLSNEEKTDYTLTLKGLIQLSACRFLKGATGANLDVLARQPLWEAGIDYKCGTGHGVGHFLNVHEGPQNFSQSMKSDAELEPGMVITIEPGVYKQGRHGIRLENMVEVVEHQQTESGTFYTFKPLTCCPIDTAPLKIELLAPRDIDYLNAYHQQVFNLLSPHLTPTEKDWLARKTAAIH
jgi:Xaa-Pro aminopeptidase